MKKSTSSRKGAHFIVVFDDGETWSAVEGCQVMCLNDEQYDDIVENGCYPKYLDVDDDMKAKLTDSHALDCLLGNR